MNYYEHHLGDWAKKCAHLRYAEEGCYRRLLDWYYANERPLPLDEKELYRAGRAVSNSEKKMVRRIVAEFFEPAEDGYHNARADRVLSQFENKLPVTVKHKISQNLRQKRVRERRAVLFETLAENGIHAPWNAKTTVLLETLREHGLPIPVTIPVTPKSVTGFKNLSRLEPVTNNHSVTGPVTGHGTVTPEITAHAVALAVTSDSVSLRAHLSGDHVRAIRQAGFPSASGADPRLAALVEAGVTPEECGLVAAEAVARSKGWAWMLATIKGRHDDARALAASGVAVEPLQTYRQRAEAAILSQWAPNMVKKP